MKNRKLFVLAATALVSLAACGPEKEDKPEEVKYVRNADEDAVYQSILGDYAEMVEAAGKIKDDNQRFVAYAEAEAKLLDSAVIVPTTTQGGNYAMTRVAPRTIPYAKWGNDEDRLAKMVAVKKHATKEFISSEERAEMISKWEAARAGGDAYDPKAYLTGKGYEIADTYATTYTTAPATLDIVNTSEQADTEILVNCVNGLLQYDNLGQLRGDIAVEDPETHLPYSVSADGKTYTFKLREDAKWVTADKTEYASVVADDFVAGFQHMLDAAAGLEFLVQGVVKNADEYLNGEATWDQVGVKAVDAHTFSIELCEPESFFPTRLTYSCFMPINRQFFLSKGGAFGVEEFAAESAKDSYVYGNVADASNMVYNGAYVPGNIVEKSEISLTPNPSYHDKDNVNFTSLKWVYDAGDNPTGLYDAVVAGTYAGVGLGVASGLLKKAQEDGRFAKYNYVTDTTTTTYLCAFNVNRGTFETGSVVSTQTEVEKIATNKAMNNIKFRKALIHAFNQESYNAISVGPELAKMSLRNMYTHPEFLSVSAATADAKGHSFPAGTQYGDMVQYYTDQLNMGIDVHDGVDGWFNATKAKQFAAEAKAELEAAGDWKGKVKLDVTYYSASASQLANANGFKRIIEETLGDYVEVKLNDAATTADFYACGYRASSGEAGNYDIFYGSGWGPDFGDPITYLDTFAPYGYMCKLNGVY